MEYFKLQKMKMRFPSSTMRLQVVVAGGEQLVGLLCREAQPPLVSCASLFDFLAEIFIGTPHPIIPIVLSRNTHGKHHIAH